MKAREGDVVRVVDNTTQHGFEINEQITIMEVYDDNYKAVNSDRSTWHLEENEIELIN